MTNNGLRLKFAAKEGYGFESRLRLTILYQDKKHLPPLHKSDDSHLNCILQQLLLYCHCFNHSSPKRTWGCFLKVALVGGRTWDLLIFIDFSLTRNALDHLATSHLRRAAVYLVKGSIPPMSRKHFFSRASSGMKIMER